ncbi:fat storage-inducing transmembrane protein 1 [Oryzias melastigma]|uniref:Fat storage-inducing transmembrane protein 1 homolog n=1 Tax=Oryzias melastigma TaxID=30732 RepID=A0A3B3CC95_ORYME|nr:fat storage-inducing transmembrane protein 1 [Oryzias melastigma]
MEKPGNSWKGLVSELQLERFQVIAAELKASGRFLLRPLEAVLELVTDLLAKILGTNLVRRHFHLVLSGLVLFGPLLSFWVSKYNIFANSNHFLYRKFLRSTWGWTCILTGSFVLLLSFSARRSVPLSLRHFSRIGLTGLIWWGARRLLTLLEDAAGSCYEPMPPAQDVQSSAVAAQPPLLLLHEDLTKASCLKGNLLWRGYEVSQDVLILCLCCLLLLEEISVFSRHLSQQRSPGAPIKVLFLLCVVLLILWMFLLLCVLSNFPNWPSQQLGGALGYLGWRGLYQGWYRLKPRWCCPGLPGEELFEKEPKRL